MTFRPALFVACLLSVPLLACGGDASPGDAASPGGDPAADAGGAGAVTDTRIDADTSGDAPTAPPPDADGQVDDAASTDGTEAPFSELVAQGVLRYLGAGWEPGATVNGSAGTISHIFQDEDGPRCFTGEEFFVSTRDGSSDELMIFVQGGGICGPAGCDAVESWPLLIPAFGLLNPADGGNPAADFDLAYVPYCDGSLFIGDADHDIDGDGTIDRSHRGLLNLSAALDVIVARYPNPSRVTIAGNSAGGMGVHFALPLVRSLYPGIPIELINDSGVGVFSPGTMESLLEYWDAEAFFPASCTDCISPEGPITGYHAYLLREDSDVRLGTISSRRDERIVSSLSGMTGEEYEAAVVATASALKGEFGERFNSMIIAGSDHTFIVRDFDRVVADTTIRAWITQFLDNEAGWASVTE